MFIKQPKKIVVIGGGTGTYTVLSGLKKYPPHELVLSAIVTVADSGGSTGRLRDEFGYLPVGDFRMALTALADDGDTGDILRRLFLYRFNKGEGLSGHNFGNLLLVAMTDMFGSEERAIELAAKILRVRGKVFPIANEKLTLAAKYSSGRIVKGESRIDEPEDGHGKEEKITSLWVEPRAEISKSAKEEIHNADFIILGPGDLYTSTLANVVVFGAKEALRQTSSKIIYIMNLMTKYGQTHNFTSKDHMNELVSYIGKTPDYVMINTTVLPNDILKEYSEERDFPVEDDLTKSHPYIILRGDFLQEEKVIKPSGDVIKRSLIRHDSHKLARAIIELL